MRVLFLSNSSGGMYMFRREVVEEIAKTNEVFLCSPQGRFSDSWGTIGCTYIPFDFDHRTINPFSGLRQIKDYKKILHNIKPDICFTYTIKPNIYGGAACASLDIPYVANITGLGTAVENAGFLQKISILLYRWGLRKAQKVFFQNAENRDFMLKHKVIKCPYDLLPGSGVNLQQYQVVPYPNDGITRFVFVARIMKEKGIDQYLEAAKSILTRHSDVEFHIFGFCDQGYEVKLKAFQEQGVIIYHGAASDMREVYGMASCTVHPTYYPEGMSNVLLESCACGRPIITTDRAGCREVVDNGVNGFVVKQRDSADLIDKIEQFLKLSFEEREKMGLAGRAKVEREFDRTIVIQKYMDEIEVTRKE